MKLHRSLFAAGSALALSLGVATPTHASEINPAQVAGETPLASVHTGETPNLAPLWRDKLDGKRQVEMWAHSPSMNRDVPLVVLKASSPNRPTLYLLNGADGGEGPVNWVLRTDVLDFYADKDINVVIPMSGAFSYYTDWVEDAPSIGGKQSWETFLTKELPGPLEQTLGANNQRAIAGMSMSATSALLMAEHNPGFYDSVASFSGCASTSDPVTYNFVRLTVNRGGNEPEQMWGPMGGEYNRFNDALINAEGLRNTPVYVSNGSGIMGEFDSPQYLLENGVKPAQLASASATLGIEGGAIEASTNACTHAFKVKMDTLGIPADYNFRPAGTHSWGYWQQDLRDSWSTIARGFGI
ncbi:alpha/beta hydrolase [Corynebacterium gerontici]|uniref:Diacylglycerol acyltransferase/mycolyltransferase Ag85A n=1 Tax=Corynebacterium gerontici TaxID=2079234 RepID=A0A3G6J745_9CORY|nr:alpha/beta hydrolase family protein [Corynebacterium gerontici]AZA12260.1 Diacylglycerol acyltransferase/mycolyltransferase Ag85A precursor [Corynebacterium gerontici]